VAVFIGGLWLTIAIALKPLNPERYRYKVTISDDVNFTEFNNKYEIVGQDGLLFTIEDKAPMN
jgi:hypothetical protein